MAAEMGPAISEITKYGDQREADGRQDERTLAEDAIGALQSRLDALQAEFDQYKADHPADGETPTPEPVTKGSMIGLSAKQEEWDEQVANIGPGLTARRIFCDLGDGPEDNARLIREAIADGYMPVLSYKIGNDVAGAIAGKFDAAAKAAGAFLKSLGVEVRFVIWHEPYGDLSAADFVRVNKRLVPLMKSEKVKAGCFINGWLLANKAPEFAAFVTDEAVAVWDWWGIDAYHAGSMTSPDPVNTPGRRIRLFLDHAKRRGITKPIGIGEYNAFSAEAIRDAGDAILDNPIIEFACMWSSQVDPSKPDFRLRGDRLIAFKETLADERAAS
jgi:hypothetical protein